MTNAARLIAFYLPQYHPTAENDEWWGKGFTEWTNVARAKPLFPGHYQPRVPADLGFYDLRLPESRAAQADLARAAGVEGFCYWHYWFNGRRLLNRPFDEVLASGEPDYPFCLGWANHTWKGVWVGASRNRLLIEQTYPGPEDHANHFRSLLPAFHDRRYIRVRNQPVFVIFRPREVPEPAKFIELWQKLAGENGLDGIHFVAHLFDDEEEYPWRAIGYGGALMTNELKLMRRRLRDVSGERLRLYKEAAGWTEKKRTGLEAAAAIGKLVRLRIMQRVRRWPGGIHSYKDAMLFFRSEKAVASGCYPSVVPNWDNSARAGHNGVILHGSTPELFGQQVRRVLTSVAGRDPEDRIVFIKSWNEWAEGNYMEPDLKFGRGYLDALRAALDEAGNANAAPPLAPLAAARP